MKEKEDIQKTFNQNKKTYYETKISAITESEHGVLIQTEREFKAVKIPEERKCQISLIENQTHTSVHLIC